MHVNIWHYVGAKQAGNAIPVFPSITALRKDVRKCPYKLAWAKKNEFMKALLKRIW